MDLFSRLGEGFASIAAALRERPLEVLPPVIVLLPLLGFAVLALFGDAIRKEKKEKGAAILACATVVVAFLLSAWCARDFLRENREHLEGIRKVVVGIPANTTPASRQESIESVSLPVVKLSPTTSVDWIRVGPVSIPFRLLVDPLSLVLLLVVTGVGSLIHIYSLGYMAHDEGRVRYFSYLNLFTFFMLLLVLGGNLPLLFVGWEGVGLCSYLLIGFWFKKASASDAGKKAFIVNRIGDAALILGIIVAFHGFGSMDLLDITGAVQRKPPEAFGSFGELTAIALLLFIGACGKSAQIPLHVWLPDAMEGPTPVSALIHAATMVTAGVYMVARLAPLYIRSETAMVVVAVVGALTAFMAATVALVQTDIKRVLAYSTVSQLGYMFLACGVGAFGYAVFHLFTHAFFKALLFLGSGSVIHAMGGEQDMRKMGGLRKKIPWTYWTFVAGTAAIAGIPFLAGYYSKDGILASALHEGRWLLFLVGLITAMLTAFYMSRLLFMTFHGGFRGSHEVEHHIHESPPTMVVPLVLLAVGSVAAGWVHIPEFVSLSFRELYQHHPHPRWFQLVGYLLPLAGIVPAIYMYLLFTDLPGRIGAALRPVQRALEAKWGFDDAFNWVARRGVLDGSRVVLWRWVDVGLIDRLVNGSGRIVDFISRGSRAIQTGLVRGYVLVILGGAVALLSYLLWIR